MPPDCKRKKPRHPVSPPAPFRTVPWLPFLEAADWWVRRGTPSWHPQPKALSVPQTGPLSQVGELSPEGQTSVIAPPPGPGRGHGPSAGPSGFSLPLVQPTAVSNSNSVKHKNHPGEGPTCPLPPASWLGSDGALSPSLEGRLELWLVGRGHQPWPRKGWGTGAPKPCLWLTLTHLGTSHGHTGMAGTSGLNAPPLRWPTPLQSRDPRAASVSIPTLTKWGAVTATSAGM